MRLLLLAATILALTACNRDGNEANQVLNEANSTGEQASNTVANAVVNAADTPLERKQALALMEQRHEGYEKIGKAMRAAKQSIDRGDAKGAKSSADQIAALAPQAIGWFPAGTGPDAGKTHAKAEIWQQRAEFDAGMTRFNQAARAFQAAAAGSDIAAIKDAHANLGKTCGSCHDRFRHKD